MIRQFRSELSVAVALALLLLLLWVAAPRFYEGDKLRSILVASAPMLVAAVGMTLVILSRNIDISIGSQFSVCGIVAGLLAKTGLPMPLVAVGTLLTTDMARTTRGSGCGGAQPASRQQVRPCSGCRS